MRDQTGNWLISGHAFRITGARTLSTMGLDAITVQLLGRWGSDAVLSDLSEAPLTNLGDRLREPMAGKKLQAVDLSSLQALRNPKDALVDAEVCRTHFQQRGTQGDGQEVDGNGS